MPIKIVIVVETFAKDMGYINNTLPKYLVRSGAEVHVVTTDLSPYHQISSAEQLFGPDFAQRNRNSPGDAQIIDGYTLHTVAHKKKWGYPKPVGLETILRSITPDVVCIFQATGWIPLECARYQKQTGYKLVIGNHAGKTMFNAVGSMWSYSNLRNLLLRTIPGWYISAHSEECVVPTKDCAEIATQFLGIPASKIQVMNLPVDTDFFYPSTIIEKNIAHEIHNRKNLRKKLSFLDDEVICVYSGKLTKDKNALVLAVAVEQLRVAGHKVRALFIGAGEQKGAISAYESSIVVPFMPISALGDYYRAADVGVWMNESISFLDGACCGLPLILSDTVKDKKHLEEFSVFFITNDSASLAEKISSLLDSSYRLAQSTSASKLANERFSGENYANRRLINFRKILSTVKNY